MQTKKYELNERAYLTSNIYDDYRVDAPPAAKPAVIICPGGGWITLSEREGEPIAIEFAKRGYIAFVLHYSVSDEPVTPGDFGLIHRAMEEMETSYGILCDLAKEQVAEPRQISVLGFSAGGQLAALFAAKHPELFSCILCYPLLDIADEIRFVSSSMCLKENREIMEKCFSVIGVSAEREKDWSSIDPIEQITPDMPRTFIWHGATDDLVRVTGSLNYAKKLLKSSARTELHIYDNCGHGISLGTRETAAVEKEINRYGTVWFAQLLRWMEELENEKK